MISKHLSISLLTSSSFLISISNQSTYLFCAASPISITTDGTQLPSLSSNKLYHGQFTGKINVEFTFLGSLNGLKYQESSNHSEDLIRGIEDLVDATISWKEADIVKLTEGMVPHVDIVTDIGKREGFIFCDL